ncbi:hypothetical protein NKH69_02715 [Mesorhizobium sp. M0976]|uniref:hypothetical protein n=1 Tax=Mesorhizobium sp. M0976 TaxID=2957038 RepID=UPI003337CE43
MDLAQFAQACGYAGDSPAMLAAFAAIRQDGIRTARQGHRQRKAAIDRMKPSRALFLAAIRPAQSAEEAIEDAARFLSMFPQHAALATGKAQRRPRPRQAAAPLRPLLPPLRLSPLGVGGRLKTRAPLAVKTDIAIANTAPYVSAR